MVEMEHLLFLCSVIKNKYQFGIEVSCYIEGNSNYKDIYLLPVKAGFISKSTQINGKLPSEATNSDKHATVKCALRFQELQAVLALYNSERLYCGKTAGFGWDVNGDKDDCESVDPAAIQETVLGV